MVRVLSDPSVAVLASSRAKEAASPKPGGRPTPAAAVLGASQEAARQSCVQTMFSRPRCSEKSARGLMWNSRGLVVRAGRPHSGALTNRDARSSGRATGNRGLGRSNLGDCPCALAAEWDDFGAEKTDRLQGKSRVHARVVETEPHEGHVELVPVLDDALRDLLRRADQDALVLQLVEVEVVALPGLTPRCILRRTSRGTMPASPPPPAANRRRRASP